MLHQPPWVCGLSTILDGATLPWIDELREKGELNTHRVRSTTISHEMVVHGVATVDLLKIDVEGHFNWLCSPRSGTPRSGYRGSDFVH